MKVAGAFFRLIRWPNLVFIILTQCLYFYCLLRSQFTGPIPINFSSDYFYLLVLASVLIAAAGYIINDYFDMHIDAINKPHKVVIDKIVKRRWAIVWHIVFSGIGLLISFYFSYKTGNWIIALGNVLCVILLWFYSTTFKKKLLTGNIIISALVAWVIFVIYFAYAYPVFRRTLASSPIDLESYNLDIRTLFKYTVVYAGLAFIVSLIREVVKDLEDMGGDARYFCKTMPLVWGVPATKVFVAVWSVVAIASITIIQFYAWLLGNKVIVVYCILLIIAPMIYMVQKLYKAVSSKDFHELSNVIKLVMLTGILSMLFFYR